MSKFDTYISIGVRFETDTNFLFNIYGRTRRIYMSGIKEELDDLFLNPKEKWEQYLENSQCLEIDTQDFISITIFSPMYPEIFKDLIYELRNKYSLESLYSEYINFEFGSSRLYEDIILYNIIDQTEIIKQIKRKFSSQKVMSAKIPSLNIQLIKQVPGNKYKIYTHLEKRQYGEAQELSKRLNITMGDFALIYHVYTFNHAFYNNDFSELYQLYTAEEGLLKNIKKSLQLFNIETDSYIRKIYSYCKEELDIEHYRNDKGYRNNEENIKAQAQIIDKITEYIDTIPIPIPYFG